MPFLPDDILLVLPNPDNLHRLQLLVGDEVVGLSSYHALAEQFAIAEGETIPVGATAFRWDSPDHKDLDDGTGEIVCGGSISEERSSRRK